MAALTLHLSAGANVLTEYVLTVISLNFNPQHKGTLGVLWKAPRCIDSIHKHYVYCSCNVDSKAICYMKCYINGKMLCYINNIFFI